MIRRRGSQNANRNIIHGIYLSLKRSTVTGFVSMLALLIAAVSAAIADTSFPKDSYEDANSRIYIYSQYTDSKGKTSKKITEKSFWDLELEKSPWNLAISDKVKNAQNKWVTTSTPYISGRGCGLLTFAHVYQWFDGKADSDYKRIEILAKLIKKNNNPPYAEGSYASYIQSAFSLNMTKYDKKKKLTQTAMQECFADGGIMAFSTNGHDACAAGYRTGSDGTIYVQVIDSTCSSTLTRMPDGGISALQFNFSTNMKDYYTWKNRSGGRYWVPFSKLNEKIIWCYVFTPSYRRISVSPNKWFSFTEGSYIYDDRTTTSTKIPAKTGWAVVVIEECEGKDGKTWYKTKDGKFVRPDDLMYGGVCGNYDLGTEIATISSTVQTIKNGQTGLYSNPYQDSVKLCSVSKKTELRLIAIVKNTANHYWLKVSYSGMTCYICANMVEEYFVGPRKDVWIDGSWVAGIDYPSGNYGTMTKEEAKSGKGTGIPLHGTIKSIYPIKLITGGWYIDAGFVRLPIPYVDLKTGKADIFVRNAPASEGYTGYTTKSVVIKDSNINTLNGRYLKALGKGSYVYQLSVVYWKYKNVTSDSELPLQEATWASDKMSFTVGGGSTTEEVVESAVPTTSITLSESVATIPKDATYSITATVSPDNATNKEIEWLTSNATVATVVKGRITAVGVGTATITARTTDGTENKATFIVTVIQPVISIKVTQDSGMTTIYPGSTLQLIKTVTPAEAKQEVTWASSNTSIASVSDLGLVTAKTPGTVTITAKATDNSGRQGTYQITILAYVDTVSLPSQGSVNVDDKIKLTPEISPANADNKEVLWKSSDASIATVDNDGNVKGLKAGRVTITATAKDRGIKSAACSVEVLQPVTEISINEGDHVLYAGKTLQLSAKVLPNNASNKSLKWKSNDEEVAVVDDNGLVTALSSGTVAITAAANDGSGCVSHAYSITVKAYVSEITIFDKNLTIGSTEKFTASVTPADAEDKRILWESSDPSIATIDQDGTVHGIAKGSVTIKATALDQGIVSKTSIITVTPAIESVTWEAEETAFTNSVIDITPTVYPADAGFGAIIKWQTMPAYYPMFKVGELGTYSLKNDLTRYGGFRLSSRNQKIGFEGIKQNYRYILHLEVYDNSGRLYSKMSKRILVLRPVSKITIEGNNAIGINGTTSLSATIEPDNASKKSIAWTSSNTGVATVDSNGVVMGCSAGTALITAAATDGSGVRSDPMTIEVIRQIAVAINGGGTAFVGENLSLTATVTSDQPISNMGVTWSSSDESIATVNSNGVVTGVSNGSVTITAKSVEDPSYFSSIIVEVQTKMVSLDMSIESAIDVGSNSEVSVTVSPSTATNRQLSWSSSDETVAIVSDNGVVTALRPGSANITAASTDGSNLSVAKKVTVYPVVETIELTGNTEMHPGDEIQWTAAVLPAEARNKGVIWSSSDDSVLTVDQSGKVTAVANGSAELQAKSEANENIIAISTINVTTLVSKISLSGTTNVDAGGASQLQATISPTGASNKQLVWTSSNSAVAIVNSQGKVDALSPGTTTLTASATDGSGVKGTIKVTVYPLPNRINLTGESTVFVNSSTQFSAEILPANVRNKNIIWSSSDTSVATVNASGVVTAKANGTALITAAAAGNTAVTAQCEIKVTTRVSSLTIDAPERINVGDRGVVTATVLPATASNKKLVWKSSDEEVAVVDAGGNVFGISGGYVTITATTTDGSEIAKETEIQIFQSVKNISIDVEPVANVGQIINPSITMFPADVSDPSVTWTSSNEDVIRIEEFESESDYELHVVCTKPGVARITATANDGSGVSGHAYIQVRPYTELVRNTATYNIYNGGNNNSKIGQISLTADCSGRAAEDKYGAVWNIEHVSGDNAAAIGINERLYTYGGFTLANGVDLMLLGINRTGRDTYRVTCTINGQADTCTITVNVENPAAPLPESVSLPTTTFSAKIGEEISVNVEPVVSPMTAALPQDANPFLYGVDAFNRYAQVTMGDEAFTVKFSKAGTYIAYVRYQGANYQYDAYVTFVITTPEGTIPPAIEEVSIDNSVMYLLPGETAKFDVSISPASADETTLQWSSSDPEVVSVAADGTMTAVSTGTSIITVSAGNSVHATGFVAVTESLLSIDWNSNDIIEVYVDGESRTVIQKVYLTPRASAQLTEDPAWTVKRKNGNNLTLTCEPVTATNGNGDLLYGCAIILKSASNVGLTEYELTCSDGVYSSSTTIQVNANSIEEKLPALVQWDNTVFTGTVNQRMTIYPVVQCWPTGTMLPDEVTISINGDNYWNEALNTEDYTVSRGMITLAFNEPGVYTANCVYSCANMRYLVPIEVRVADSSGKIPVRLMKLTLNESEISIKPGDKAQLTAAFAPTDASNKSLSWSSDNTSVATISANGLVTAVSNGRANITCTPMDTNCVPVRCTVIVEDVFTVVQYQEMDSQYLQGETGNPVAGFRLSDGTAKRMNTEGLTPSWKLTRKSGNAATVELREYNGTQFIVVAELKAGGKDTYEVTCTAGAYSWTGRATLNVQDLGADAPEQVTIATTSYTASVGEAITLDFTPHCEPNGSSIPAALEAEYIGIGDIYSALMDDYRYSLFSAGDVFTLGFRKPGIYLLSRQYRSCNLTYVTECKITVEGGRMNLLKCTDEEAVVYIGGKSSIASTCIIRDTSIEELYGDQLVWSAERISGNCLTAALRADQSSASLYVANAKEEGEEVWRISCSFKDITDYVDITIHAVQARSELPEAATLYQTDFDGMIGNMIAVPLAVECSPEGTFLPNTEDEAWSFATDENTRAHAKWSFMNGHMEILFSESGYYGGDLVYKSGNVSYRFRVNFAITDEELVQAAPGHLEISLSAETITVYPEGETGVAVANAVLTDSLDAYSLDSVAAYAERNHAVWSIEVLSGGACTLSVRPVKAGVVQLMLDSITGSGDVTYRLKCSVAGKTSDTEGTIHVATANEARPEPELKQSYFTTATGTALTVDASFYNHTHTIKLCSGKDSVWNNENVLEVIGYEYEKSGDLLLPIFYEAGSYVTTITSRIGNLTFSKELVIAVYTSRTIPASPSKLTFPRALQEIEDEAFEGITVNIIDLRGTSIRTIGPRAFAGAENLMRVYIPGSVTTISSSAFADCTDFVIYCNKGSYADTWAQSMKYPVSYNMD